MSIDFKYNKRVIALGITFSIICSMFLWTPSASYAEVSNINTEYENASLNVSGNIIYINLNKEIKAVTDEKLKEVTELYKMPKPDGTAIDNNGNTYDKTFIYNFYNFGEKGKKIIPNSIIEEKGEQNVIDAVYNANSNTIDKFKFLEDLTSLNSKEEPVGMDIVPVEKVEIINNTTIKITPKQQLKALNKYGIKINKSGIKYKNGSNLNEDILATFWTNKDNANTTAKWLQPEKTENEIIKKNNANFYTISNAPQYGKDKPIVLKLDKEVIPTAKDDILEQKPDDPRDTKRISYDALQEIELIDVYGTEAAINEAEENKENESDVVNKEDLTVNIDFEKYEFSYYFEDNIKKTKLSLYPNKDLDFGKKYELIVPKDSLESRSSNAVADFKADIIVKGNSDDNIEAYTAENNKPKVTEIWEAGKWEFKIFGRNFNKNIERIELAPIGENLTETIKIEKEDIEFRSVTELRPKIRGKNARKFSTEKYAGRYAITLYFNNINGTLEEEDWKEVNTNLRFNLLTKENPLVIGKDPEGSSDKWYNENDLGLAINPKTINGVKRYFLRVTFEDIDGNLEFNTDSGLDNLLNSEIAPSASDTNYLDTEFISQVKSNQDMIKKHIFYKNRSRQEAYLFIPVKLLSPQITYEVTISAGVVHNDAGDNAKQYNEAITDWTFTTMTTPEVKEEDIVVKSIVEDYDEDEPLIIYGDFFYDDTIDVYFNKERADDVDVEVDDNGRSYLEVYLPNGRDKLDPGLYNIEIENSRNHNREIYGTLSVVPEGEHIPEDGYRVKESNRYEEVIETVSRSEDTLYLEKYRRNSSIELDLDELMGKDTLSRKIVFEYGNSDRIREIDTYSKYANINLYDVYVKSEKNKESYLYLGRVEPFLAQNLKRTLKNYNIKSEMIQIVSNDVSIGNIEIELPYDKGNEKEFIVLRYDDISRSWNEEVFNINKVDQRVIINTVKEGIFVVVESK